MGNWEHKPITFIEIVSLGSLMGSGRRGASNCPPSAQDDDEAGGGVGGNFKTN